MAGPISGFGSPITQALQPAQANPVRTQEADKQAQESPVQESGVVQVDSKETETSNENVVRADSSSNVSVASESRESQPRGSVIDITV